METIKFNVDTAAVDAMILTKDKAVPTFAKSKGVSLDRIAVIGDGPQDLCFMDNPSYALVGAPANAKPEVLEAVAAMPNGRVYQQEGLDSFFQFFEDAGEAGATHIVSDKDGVLKIGGNYRGDEFLDRVSTYMGVAPFPMVTILTGSSLDQNLDFMNRYHLNTSLDEHSRVRQDPYLILAENGAIHVNILDPTKIKNMVSGIDQHLLHQLKGPFEYHVLERVAEEVLPRFDFTWSVKYNDQQGKVYAPSHFLSAKGDRPKESMVTINVPRQFANGEPFRGSSEAVVFRDALLQIYQETASQLDLPYEMLSRN